MIITVASSVKRFCKTILKLERRWQQKIIPRIITALLTCNGDPNYASLARTVLNEKRNRSSVKRFFQGKRFDSRADYRRAFNEVVRKVSKTLHTIMHMPWFIILDGTSTKRGGFTKIMNAIKYRFKDKSKKGKSTKAHMFLMGILLLGNGMRVPLPRKSYYTKEYCKATGRKHVSIVKLAVQMISEVQVPKGTNVIVLADEYFEGKDVHDMCTTLGFSYIMPLNSTRCFADENGVRLHGKTVHNRGISIPMRDLKKIRLVSGREKTASYRRLSNASLKKSRIYYACAEQRTVAGLGNVLLTYSRKRKQVNGKKAATFRVIVSNNLAYTAAMVVEYYELRWQIELFFREMKSVIGFDRFRGTDFKSFERYIDVLLMSFLFLEWRRVSRLHNKSTNKKEKSTISRMRTQGIIESFRREAIRESADFIVKTAKTKKGRVMLKTIFGECHDAA